MLKKNKQNYQIAAIKRRNLTKFKSKPDHFDLFVCIKSSHNKRFVIEKLGSYSEKKFFINSFRLVFWLQFNVSFNIKADMIMRKYLKIIKALL